MTRKVGGGVLGRPLHLELVGLDVWTKKGSSFEELDVYKKKCVYKLTCMCIKANCNGSSGSDRHAMVVVVLMVIVAMAQ